MGNNLGLAVANCYLQKPGLEVFNLFYASAFTFLFNTRIGNWGYLRSPVRFSAGGDVYPCLIPLEILWVFCLNLIQLQPPVLCGKGYL